MPRMTALHKAEAELIAFGLAMPETTIGPGWATTCVLKVRGKMFFVFSDGKGAPAELKLTMKLPVSVDMVQDLYFVQESTGWYRQHDWVTARFSADDDIAAEIPTLKGWMTQSYCAMAPKRLARLVRDEAT